MTGLTPLLKSAGLDKKPEIFIFSKDRAMNQVFNCIDTESFHKSIKPDETTAFGNNSFLDKIAD